MNFLIKPAIKTIVLCSLVATFVGCANKIPVVNDIVNSEFADCSSAMTSSKISANNPAKYHLTAKQALSCLGSAPFSTSDTDKTLMMQLHALAIVNLVKSGELTRAKSEQNRFKRHYRHTDLMLVDGSSFVDSLDLLLGEVPVSQADNGSLLNASASLKSELRRQQYWKAN